MYIKRPNDRQAKIIFITSINQNVINCQIVKKPSL